jgi:hypothetical protein
MYRLKYRKMVAEILLLTQHKGTSLHASSNIDTQRLADPVGHHRLDSFVSKRLLVVKLSFGEVKMMCVSVTKK